MTMLLLRVCFWGFLLLAAARVGAWVTGSRLTGLAHMVWDGIVGLALTIAALLTVGLLPGCFRPAVTMALIAVLFVIAAARTWKDPAPRFHAGAPSSAATYGLLVLICTLLCAGLLWDRVPPLFYDSLAYHFAQPESWLVDGRIAPQPWSLHSWFPPGISVLYGVGLMLGGHTWANDANLLLGLLLIGLAYDLGTRLWSTGAGLAAAMLLPAFPLILYALAIPAADLGHGLFTAAALGALLLSHFEDDTVWVRRAAWLSGGALLTKYLAFLVPLAVGFVWLFLAPGHRPGVVSTRTRIRAVARFALPALCLVAPWLVANAVTVGNPVAPALAGLLPIEGLAEGGDAVFRIDARGGLPGIADLRNLGPRLFVGDDGESALYPTPAWGWMPVLFLVGLAAFVGADRRLQAVSGLALGLFALWFFTFRWERFLVTATLLIAVALGGVLTLAWRRGRVYRLLHVAAALLAAGSLILACQAVLDYTGAMPVLLGREEAGVFLERSFPTVALYREASEALDPDATRLLIVGEMRHYGLALSRVAPTGFNAHPLSQALASKGGPAEANRILRGMGFTHVVVDKGWIVRSSRRYPSLAFLSDHPALLDRWLQSLGRPVAARGSAALFAIPH